MYSSNIHRSRLNIHNNKKHQSLRTSTAQGRVDGQPPNDCRPARRRTRLPDIICQKIHVTYNDACCKTKSFALNPFVFLRHAWAPTQSFYGEHLPRLFARLCDIAELGITMFLFADSASCYSHTLRLPAPHFLSTVFRPRVGSSCSRVLVSVITRRTRA